MSEDVIQPAEPGDADAASRLLCSTDRSLYRYLSGGDLRMMEAFVAHQWRQEACLFCYRLARVVRASGEVIALVLRYTAEEHLARPQHRYERLPPEVTPGHLANLERAFPASQYLFPVIPPGALYVQNLAVAPAARSRGLGTALMRDALEAARQKGCSTCHLDVEADNPAVALYRRLGFEVLVETRMPALQASDGLPPHLRLVRDVTP